MTLPPAPVPLSTSPPDGQVLAPPVSEPSAAPGDPSPASPTRKKSPKKKKLSKKERARLRREREEQERLEAERRAAEERDKREREYERKKRLEQQERLRQEDQSIHALRQQRADDNKRIRAVQAQADDWELFKQCNHFVDVRSQADVNAFVTTWRDHEESELPELFEGIERADRIIRQLTIMTEAAEVSHEQAVFDRCRGQIEEIRALVFSKLDGITMHHLVFSDRYAGAKNEVQVSAESGGIALAMWVNLSKNPRVKDIEFPG
jgi:cancer susceptibility candidate protein 1